jgi:hypothetical protein
MYKIKSHLFKNMQIFLKKLKRKHITFDVELGYLIEDVNMKIQIKKVLN